MNQKLLLNTLFFTRIIFGLLFLLAGVNKLTSGFDALPLITANESPLNNLIAYSLGKDLINFLVIWGEILIGVAVISGTFLRLASFFGVLMMVMFYIAFFPDETGYINHNVIYSLVFIILSASGSGRYLGIDKYLENFISSKGLNKLRFVLG